MSEDSSVNKKITKNITAGLDLGDRYTHLCLLDTDSGEVLEEGKVRTTPEGFARRFDSAEPFKVALEVGTHSPWVSRLLTDFGHEVVVANPRRTRLIYGEDRKTDKIDAEKLARLARADTELLHAIEHRNEDSQVHLSLIHSREALVPSRTQLINYVRGTAKSLGARLPGGPAKSFHNKVYEHLPAELLESLGPIVETIGSLTEQIKDYDRLIERKAVEEYPETELLRQVPGVGPLTALTFALTLEDPHRFDKSRSVGAYLGLVPGTEQSGQKNPQKGISKAGDEMLRRLLVTSAQYILGPFAKDSDLRRHGRKIAERGGKNAKKRAVVAVARKLSVLLHHLWISGQVYEPLHNTQ